jgi:hypothetical protein
MEISGHRSRDIFRRYNITETKDIKLAMEKMNTYVEGLNE